MNALDTENGSSCYNSDGQADGNTDTSFTVTFHRTVSLSEIRIQFQGGFVPEECEFFTIDSSSVQRKSFERRKGELDSSSGAQDWTLIEDAYIEPQDNNEMQSFDLTEMENTQDRTCDAIRFQFKSSSDFYGRVTIYKLEVWGNDIE